MTAASSYAMALLDVLWRHSCSAAILVALVLLARSVAFRGPAARWRTALWALVLARLLIPVVPPSRLSIGNAGDWVTHARDAWQARHPAVLATIGAGPVLASSGQIVRRGYLPPDALPAAALLPAHAVERLSWPLALAAAWVLGAVWVIARRVVSHARFVRRLKREPIITEGPLADLLARACEQMGIRRRPALRLTTAVTTPALVGLVRPQLLIPPSTASSLAPEQLRLVLLHELAHLRRGDLWVDLLATLLVAMHWFNPFVWLAAALYRSDRELARDAMVLRAAGEGEAQAYGRTIVLLLEQLALTGPATPTGGVGILERWGGVRQRIRCVASFGRPSLVRGAMAVVAIALVGCCGLTDRRTGTAAPPPPPTTMPAAAEPVDDSPSVPAWLARDVGEVYFNDKPLADAVKFLSNASGGANFSVRWPVLAAAGIPRDATVTFRLRHATLRKALNTALADVSGGRMRLDFAPMHDVIVISTADDIARSTASTRTYEINDLLVDVPDFDNAPTLGMVPTTGPSNPPPPPAERTMSRDERIQAIIKLIRETVDPNSWDKFGAIREHSGRLVVWQSEANHAQIASLMEQLCEARAIQITIEARFFTVDDKAAALEPTLQDVFNNPPATQPGKLLKMGTYLDDVQVEKLLKGIEARGDIHRVAAPRITLFNGQRAWVMSATQTAYVSDVKVVRGTKGDVAYEPQRDAVNSGSLLDVQATISADRRYVTMTLRPQVSRLEGFQALPQAAGSGTPPIQRPILTTSGLETTVSVPDGATLLTAGFSPVDKLDGRVTTADPARVASKPSPRVFLLVRPRIVPNGRQRVRPPRAVEELE